MQSGGRVHEIDHVVLVGGTIFIVEVKNYKGRLVWEDSTRNGLLQIKTGRYGEAVEAKESKKPRLTGQAYIYPAKEYLARVCDPVRASADGTSGSLYMECGYHGDP
jgi:Holliday junction resolvase-like predicted endonuclease